VLKNIACWRWLWMMMVGTKKKTLLEMFKEINGTDELDQDLFNEIAIILNLTVVEISILHT
jgi:hypothetical protein